MKRLMPAAFYLALALALMAPLLPEGYYVTLDMKFGPSSFMDHQFDDFYGFIPSSYGAYFPIRMMLAAVSWATSPEIAEKLLLFSILFLSGISAHSLVPEKEGLARYFAGLMYLVNPFVFVRFLAGHWSFLLSYALWPLCLKHFMEFLEEPRSAGKFASVALLTGAAAVSSHGVIMLLAVYAFAALFHLLRKGLELETVKRLALLSAAVLVMNLYWIIPTVLLYGDTYAPAQPEDYLGDFSPQSSKLSLGAALATLHGFWRGGFFLTMDVFGFWYLLYFPILALAVIGLIRLIRERALTALLFIAIFLAGFLLALGQASPLSWLFSAFGESFPLYFLFRDSQKFVGLMALSYSYLGALGASSVASMIPKRKAIIVVILCLLPVAYDFGFFGLFGQIRPTIYPPDWGTAEASMSGDSVDGRVLVIPAFLYNWYPWINATQKTAASPATQFFSRPVMREQNVMTSSVYSDVRDPQGRYLSFLQSNRERINETAELLAPLGIRYIIVLKNYTESTHSLFLFKRKAGVAGMTETLDLPSLYLFRNEKASGTFISTDHPGNGTFKELLELSSKEELFSPVKYEMITPARYRIVDAGGRHIIYTGPPSRFFSYGGKAPETWYGIASSFEAGPAGGEFVNSLFPAILALFILSWMLGLYLIFRPPLLAAPALVALGGALSVLIFDGNLSPPGIGALLLLSAALVAVVKTGLIKGIAGVPGTQKGF